VTAPSCPDPKHIPSVDRLLRDPGLQPLLATYGHTQLRDNIRAILKDLRRRATSGGAVDLALEAIAGQVGARLARINSEGMKAVFNLTGTILHTNLGRAPLPQVAVDAMVAAAGAVNLEYDLGTGGRGQRDRHLEKLICQLTGAEAAVVVNNNAAAVLIALNTLALARDVIVSRGELIEIGGAFRLPDIMQRAGCTLRETGTTNRTHAADFQSAIGPETAMILKVHTSNYQLRGFCKSVPEAELAALANARGIPFVVDLGSGTLIDLVRFGLPRETTVRETLKRGADLVTFSGDKLLGGPQAGIIAGRADLIARISANPMQRAMRLDKITIAALAAVLRLYRNPDNLAAHLPTLGLLSRDASDIKAQAERLQPEISAALHGVAQIGIAKCRSQIGSGALPVDLLDSYALTLRPTKRGDSFLRDLAAALRGLARPIIGRIHNGALFLDLRALSDERDFTRLLATVPDALPTPI
jgi:L-seryl-tRNA(Ser) seleniumtransferase